MASITSLRFYAGDNLVRYYRENENLRLACVQRGLEETRRCSCLFDSGPDRGVFHRLAALRFYVWRLFR